MDRIGLAGAQGTGKSTLAKRVAELNGYKYIDAGVGAEMSRLGVRVGESMPLHERLLVQLAIANHIADKSSGSNSFVMDRTTVDVMAYTIDLFGQSNDERCVQLFAEIQRVCFDTAIQNFNIIVGLRPGVELSSNDKEREQRGSLDPLYVRRIDALICGELNHLNLFGSKQNLTVGFMPPSITELDARVRSLKSFIDTATKGHIRPALSTLH
jgi:hypothetical protein